MQKCVLCGSHNTKLAVGCDKHFVCSLCGLYFLEPSQRLAFSEEKYRYEQHNNDVNDPRYRAFLTPLFNEISSRLHTPSCGLDFGAGRGPMLATMLEETNHKMTLYDPMFFDSQKALTETYDFIVSSEAVEHFFDPLTEFRRMRAALKPSGFLAIMTSMVTSQTDFKNWYYRKDPCHVVFYTEHTFRWLAQQIGDMSVCFISDKIIVFEPRKL